ncbi:hypothetical protein [Subtercola boreus]|uniref:hypothetical protein n=1 Tax=Subtercola boreus TaxID=120213 RepID=UPI0011C07877|nr:hypothetical protein [Subtercola boreus]
MLDELAGTQESADWLVAAGYWEALADGWQFVAWEGQQPLRAATLESRRKNTEKVANWRNKQVGNPVTNAGTNPKETLPPSRTRTRPNQVQKDSVQRVERVGHVYSVEFESFWEVYPRHQAKRDAEKAFEKVQRTTELDVILAGARS